MLNPSSFRRWLPWCIVYVLVLVAAVAAMRKARDWAVVRLSTPKSIADWQAWRDDVQRQQGQTGPVQRRVPKSAEPPALVMMRDHFGVSLAGVVLFGTILYWVVAWFVLGVTKR
jgi:hypothetical protein